MTDSDDFTERFSEAHEHLDAADELLSELARDVEDEIEAALSNSQASVEYNLDSTTLIATLPLDRVISRLNRSLSPPFYATREGDEIRVLDVREEFGIDEVFDAVSEDVRTDGMSVREVVTMVSDDHVDEPGAPEEVVVAIVQAAGIVTDGRREIENLKSHGEIYEPKKGYIRTT